MRERKLARIDFDRIYTDYSRLVYWAAYRVIARNEVAEDVTQTVFERVLLHDAKIASLSEPQLKSWLYRTATNLAIDIVRKSTHEQTDANPIGEELADEAPTPEAETLERAKSERVRRAVDSLDEVYRQVILLHYYSNLTVREISEYTGISDGTIKSRLVRARMLLADKLEDEVD